MLLDNKGKLFGKVSIIDFIIVLMLILGFFGLYLKSSKSKTITPLTLTKTSQIKTTFYTTELPQFVADSIKEGDIVKDSQLNTNFGKITSIKFDKSLVYTTNSDGEMLASTKPGFVSVKFEVQGNGLFSNNGVTFDSSDYFIGKTLLIKVGNSTFYTTFYNFNN